MEKLETWAFYLLVFSIPFETRVIVVKWTQPFNEWTAGYVYGTDILLAALFVFWLMRSLKAAKIFNFQFSIFKRFSNPNLWLAAFFLVSALSIFNSHIVGLSLYQLLKLAEFIGFYFYLRSAFGKVYEFRKALAVIIASGVFQAAVAIAQHLKQGNLGLRLLGESPLSVDATGVAVFISNGVKYLRAYGTTPHPNVLAAWLFLAIFAFYFWYFYYLKFGRKGFWWIGVYAVLLFGLFSTFSRTIIALWALGAVVRTSFPLFKGDSDNFFPESVRAVKSRLAAVAIATLAVIGLFSAIYWPQVWSRIHISAGEEAVTQRIFYNKIAESVTTANPVLGVGIGQFVPQLMDKLRHWPAYIYQPVHNVYLLIASETGLVGLALFLLFLFFIFYGFVRRTQMHKAYQCSFLILAFSFLLMSLFDHFLWTLQQGSLIFWMVLALISLKSSPG